MLVIETDGSHEAEHGSRGAWAFVAWEDGRIVHAEADAGEYIATNEIGELAAILYALRWATAVQLPGPILLKTDSSDSVVIIRRMSGKAAPQRELRDAILGLLARRGDVTLIAVKHLEVTVAHQLARRVLRWKLSAPLVVERPEAVRDVLRAPAKVA